MIAPAFTPEQVAELHAKIVDTCSTMIDLCSGAIGDPEALSDTSIAFIARMAFRQIGAIADGLNGYDCNGSASKWIVGFDMPNNAATRGDAA